MMGCWQRRIGPLNIGIYGILSVVLNGINLIISYMIIPNIYYSYVFQLSPIIYLICGFSVYSMIYPFYMNDDGMSLLGILVINGISMIWIVLSGWCGSSKYSMIGVFRILAQFINLEFIMFSIVYMWWYKVCSIWVVDW